MQFNPAKTVIGVVVLSLLGLVLLRSLAWHFYFPTYTPKTMTPISAKTTTHCVGRYLIDLPSDLNDIYVGPASTFYYGLDKNFKKVEYDVKRGDFTREQFEAAANERVAELKTQTNAALKIPLLLHREIFDMPGGGKAILIRFLDNEFYSISSVKSEVYARAGSHYVLLSADSFSSYDSVSKPSGYPVYKDIDPQPAEARLMRIAKNMRDYTDANKAGEGFCVNGVVFNRQTMGYDEEQGGIEFNYPDKDFWINIRMSGATGGAKDTLFERSDESMAYINKLIAAAGNPDDARTEHIRRDTPQIDGMAFQEVFDRNEEKGKTSFIAQIENRPPQQTFKRPFITLELTSGTNNNTGSNFSQEQLLPVWSAAIKTLRLSPANAAASVPAPYIR